MKPPLVSVILPVYNAAAYLRRSIDSMLCQTWRNFELLIINDGSYDQSDAIIRSYRDKRICLLNHRHNTGLVEALNQGLNMAQGQYVARMDADDISLPERLTKQVLHMEQNSDTVACGMQIELIDSQEHKLGRSVRYPLTCETIQCRLLFQSALAHPSVMIRADVLRQSGLRYRSEFTAAEDYDLWIRLTEYGHLINLADTGIRYRLHGRQVCSTHCTEQKRSVQAIQKTLLAQFNLHPSPLEADIHFQLGIRKPPLPPATAQDVAAWLTKLAQSNQHSLYYPEPAFHQLIEEYRALYGLLPQCSGPPAIRHSLAWHI